jgi:uncharacterized protein YndB with AHSA1/START domain
MTKTTPSVTLVRRIKATPAKVFAALTDPTKMIRWWGPDAGPTLRADADVRPGGRFSIVFRLLNGDEHNPTGEYREVIPDRKLVFTWEWAGMPERESLVTFLLQPIDGGIAIGRRAGQLGRKIQPRERRSQLMRDVLQQPPLGHHQRLNAIGHHIE